MGDSPITNKLFRREDVGRLYGLTAATVYRLISKKRCVPGRTPCTGL